MSRPGAPPADRLALDRLPIDRRAAELRRAFRVLARGEVFWVSGTGDPSHYEHFLRKQFPGEVHWLVAVGPDGNWVARVGRG